MSSPRADPLRNLNALRNELVHHLEPTALERKVDAFVRPLRSHLSLALPPEQNALLRARTGEPGPYSDDTEGHLRATLSFMFSALVAFRDQEGLSAEDIKRLFGGDV